MVIKGKITDNFYGIKCECEKEEEGCNEIHPHDRDMKCSRDKGHKGKHFACSEYQHRIYKW